MEARGCDHRASRMVGGAGNRRPLEDSRDCRIVGSGVEPRDGRASQSPSSLVGQAPPESPWFSRSTSLRLLSANKRPHLLRRWNSCHITVPTALREMWTSSSVGAADTENFQYHSPNPDRIRREFRHDSPWQATAWGWVQVSRRYSPPTSTKSWPCLARISRDRSAARAFQSRHAWSPWRCSVGGNVDVPLGGMVALLNVLFPELSRAIPG